MAASMPPNTEAGKGTKMAEVVKATEIRKAYDGLEAVKGVSFRVERGECYGLLGPNGAGKTSIIRMIYGFSPLSSGELRVFGMNIRDDWRKIRNRIGVCQQQNALDPDLTVEENLAIFAGYFCIPSDEAKKRSDELLDFFALGPKRKAKVLELSGGLARRLTVARALINHPELVILDEPTTGLDPQSRHQLWERLIELRTRGVTLILTTHYMEEASYLCDRVMIIDHGKILTEGQPDELIQQYAGHSVVEVEGADQNLRAFLEEKGISHEVLERRIIVYTDDSLGDHIRSHFCAQKCTFRTASLEDVFLRLTGRELRE
jgi:lipooligosaccharide transport system ATP-binding protein